MQGLTPASPIKAMPYGIIVIWGTYSIVDQPPLFTFGLFPPLLSVAPKQAGDRS
jgi:hypothetical protein